MVNFREIFADVVEDFHFQLLIVLTRPISQQPRLYISVSAQKELKQLDPVDLDDVVALVHYEIEYKRHGYYLSLTDQLLPLVIVLLETRLFYVAVFTLLLSR